MVWNCKQANSQTARAHLYMRRSKIRSLLAEALPFLSHTSHLPHRVMPHKSKSWSCSCHLANRLLLNPHFSCHCHWNLHPHSPHPLEKPAPSRVSRQSLGTGHVWGAVPDTNAVADRRCTMAAGQPCLSCHSDPTLWSQNRKVGMHLHCVTWKNSQI